MFSIREFDAAGFQRGPDISVRFGYVRRITAGDYSSRQRRRLGVAFRTFARAAYCDHETLALPPRALTLFAQDREALMRFISLDVETANADMASICQIGAARFVDGAVVAEWNRRASDLCQEPT